MEQGHSLREFIYIDNVEINSILAQLNGGLETVLTKTDSFEESSLTRSDLGGEINGKGSIGFPALVNGKAGGSLKANKGTGSEDSVGQESSRQTVYNDYSVEVLEKHLKENMLLKTLNDELRYGDIIKLNENFDLIDFKSLKTVSEKDIMKKIMSYADTSETQGIAKLQKDINILQKQVKGNQVLKEKLNGYKDTLKKLTKEQEENEKNIEAIHILAEFGSHSFNNTILLSGETFISYAKNENFRMNSSQLGMLMNNPRKGIIIGVIENKFSNNGIDLQEDFEAKDIGKIGSFLTTTLLQNFNLAQSDSYMIKPLAIYFE